MSSTTGKSKLSSTMSLKGEGTESPLSETESERRQYQRKVTLFSALPLQVLLAQLDAGFIADPSDRQVLSARWKAANSAYALTGSASLSFLTPDDIQQLDQTRIDKEIAAKVLERAKCYPPYDSHPTQICNVRLAKLLTPQITVSEIRARKRTPSGTRMSDQDLFQVAFEYGTKKEPVTHQILGVAPTGGSVIFTSFDEDIRLHHPPQFLSVPINIRDPESVKYDGVSLPVGGGLPFAAAFRISLAPGLSRLIANNGIHRAYALAKQGYEWFPMLVTDLSPLELPDPFVELPKGMLLDPNVNPPMVTDFLREDVVIPLDYHRLLKTVRLNWNFEQYATILR